MTCIACDGAEKGKTIHSAANAHNAGGRTDGRVRPQTGTDADADMEGGDGETDAESIGDV